jgi:hypothetical protein
MRPEINESISSIHFFCETYMIRTCLNVKLTVKNYCTYFSLEQIANDGKFLLTCPFYIFEPRYFAFRKLFLSLVVKLK